jgi:hypothetical protein
LSVKLYRQQIVLFQSQDTAAPGGRELSDERRSVIELIHSKQAGKKPSHSANAPRPGKAIFQTDTLRRSLCQKKRFIAHGNLACGGEVTAFSR